MTFPVIAVDPMLASAHIVRFNENANAASACGLFGIRASRTVNLRLTLYGGVFRGDGGTVVVVPEQHVTLTPSATNYVRADNTDGTLTVTTIIPAGWPGPLATGIALYTLVVGANSITSGTSHITGRKSQGPRGAKGPTGQSGPDFWSERRGLLQVIGDGNTLPGGNVPGLLVTTIGGGGTISLASTDFYTSILKTRFMWRSTNNMFSIARGMELNIRFGLDASTTFVPSNHSFFAGFYDVTPGTPAQTGVEPSSLVNLVGVGSDSTDTLVQLMHNDGSGSATKVSLGASFPSKTTGFGGVGRIYDLILTWEPGASQVSYVFTNANSGAVASGTISSNLPSSSQLLGFMGWAGLLSGAATFTCIMTCQISTKSRF